MLTIQDRMLNHTCAGFGRREFLKAGALGMAGFSLQDLLKVKAASLAQGKPFKNKSVVLLFLQGGPPHIEFFDPKMTAPAEYRSITGEIPTNIPGVTFGSTFPKLAKMTDKLAVV
ncbi:uncharacterized protein METZ01_LOCUS448596, partial [marine metagenome]